jgi:4-amino-4-deoxy-L-arabinose transferase-like glycosyltransferase
MTEHNEQSGRFLACLPYLLLALVVTVVVFVRIRLLQAPLERDEGEYAYMGQLMIKGVPPYVLAYSMKLPGVSAAYAAIMLLFGQSATGIHLGLLIVNGICAFLVFLLARRLFDRNAAVCSCACFAVLSLSQSVYGIYAHATHFVALFALAGSYILLRTKDAGRKCPLFLSGLCFGVAFTMKQHAALFIVFGVTYLVGRSIQNRGSGAKSVFAGITLFLLGTIIPFALILLYYAKAGRFEPMWFWTVQYASEYASGQTFAQGLPDFAEICGYLFSTQPSLWLLAGVGVAFLCTRRGRCTDKTFLVCFFFFSFLTVCPGLYFRGHYFVTLLPAVALMSGAAIFSLGELLAARKTARYWNCLPLFLFMACVAYGLCHEKNYFYLRTPLEVSRSLYGLNPFPEALQVARYLKDHTTAEDRVAVLGSEPEIYFYADRLSASGYIYMYGLMENQPYAERMQRQMISDIELSHPKYVVLVSVDASWLKRPSSPRLLSQWQGPFLRTFYQPVGVIDIFATEATRYLWDDKVAGYTCRSDSFLTVYKRKG